MHGHQGWNVRHGLWHIYMRYVYIVYIYELFIAFVCFVVCSLLYNDGMCGVLCGKVAGLGSIQFRNWNCNRNWNWWNWKWNWNWRLWNWNWKPELNFLQLLPQHLLVNQQFPIFSFNRGHNLPCDWLLMQQGLSSWNIAPCSVVTKDTWGGYLVPLE